MTVADLVDMLHGVRQVTGGYMARCPAHEDKRPSLSVSEGKDGSVLLYCHAGCKFEDVVRAIGVEMRELSPRDGAPFFRTTTQQRKPPKPDRVESPPLEESQVVGWHAALKADAVAWRHVTEVLGFSAEAIDRWQLGLYAERGRRWLMYPYRKDGTWSYAKGRSIDGDKAFLRMPKGRTSYPYGAEDIQDGGTTILVEGERDALAVWTMGLHREVGGETGAAVVSLPDGAKERPSPDLVAMLAGQKRVYLFLDADGPGDAAAAGLTKELGPRCRRVRLKEHKDAGDLLSQLGPDMGLDAALAAVREAEDKDDDPSGTRAVLRKAIVRFSVEELAEPPPRQEHLWFPYVPTETVAVLSGPGGSSKTTLLTALAVHRSMGLPFLGTTLRRGKTAILTTEDRRIDYRRKIFALRHEIGGAFDDQAVADGVVVVDCSGMPIRLVEADKGNWHPTLVPDHLAVVLKESAPDTDLVVMETISRLAGGTETNESLAILVESAQRLCRLAGVSVVLVGHVGQESARQGHIDAYTARGGSALGDNGRSSIILQNINENNCTKLIPDAEIPPEMMGRIKVLAHPKANGPTADPVLLERVSTEYGAPVLRLYEPRAKDPLTAPRRVVNLVKRLAGPGLSVTRTTVRDHATELGIPQRQVNATITRALELGWLTETAKTGVGRPSTCLVPTGRDTQ